MEPEGIHSTFYNFAKYNPVFIILIILIGILFCSKHFYEYFGRNYSMFNNPGNYVLSNTGVGMFLQTKNPPDLEYWINYHIKLGIDKFYIFVEDTPGLETILNKYGNKVKYMISSSTMGGGDGISWGAKLDSRIEKNFNSIIEDARMSNIQWLFKLDDDELLYVKPGKSIKKVLLGMPSNISRVIIKNYEAFFSKVNKTPGKCFVKSKFANCVVNPEFCVAYRNGKSVGRLSDAGLKLAGSHRFLGNDKEIKLTNEDIILLHFESCSYAGWNRKFEKIGEESDHKVYDGYKNTDEYTKKHFPYYYKSMKAFREHIDDDIKEELYKHYRVDPYYDNDKLVDIPFEKE